MSELDALSADLRWIRKNMESQDRLMADIFERLRTIETELAQIQAKQKPPISGWTVFGIVATVAVSALLILDRLYLGQ
jgi:hypothetical protein